MMADSRESGHVPLVQVLLSTYNGERFLREQLDSLFAQDYPNVRILARDDGSTDGTLALLKEYAAQSGLRGCGALPRVEVLVGANLGVGASFLELVARADQEAAYVAFCDQDDFWLPHKISQALACLRSQVPDDIPGLVWGRCTLVDENLEVLGHSKVPGRGPSFANALAENIATGCTLVLNRAAVRLLAGHIPGPAVLFHDWWAYLTVAAFGRVVYDSTPAVLYRQHGANAVGARPSAVRRWGRRLRRLVTRADLHVESRQASEFQRMYGPLLPEEPGRIIRDFLGERAGFWRRVRYLFRTEVHRQTPTDDLVFRVRYALNLI